MSDIIDTYLTINGESKGEYSEKRSKFLAFAFHVENVEQIKELVSKHEKEYYDARHVCYAYMLGYNHDVFRSVDNGEPSGTAGKPILGQIVKYNVTNILIIVVRYFGGIKLGTSGLTNAYKQATIDVLENSNIEERTVDSIIEVGFEYPLMNEVMKVIKNFNLSIVEQDFQMQCRLLLRIRLGEVSNLSSRLSKIRGVTVKEK